MQSFIGSIPVSTRFAPEIPRSLVPIGVGHALGRASDIGQRFVEVLTAEYMGRSLTTDVECEIVSPAEDTVVIGSNWLAAWACVEHPDLYSSRNTGQSTTSSANTSGVSRGTLVPSLVSAPFARRSPSPSQGLSDHLPPSPSTAPSSSLQFTLYSY